MTNPLTQALRHSVDQTTADYIDAVQEDAANSQAAGDVLRMAMVDQLASTINEQALRIDALERAFTASTRDDRYALTKAKLVRLMTDLGYLED